MSKVLPLTLSFLEKRPESAARGLSALSPVDAAAFLDEIPTRYAVSALNRMGEWSSSQAIASMKDSSAAAALREMDVTAASATLRLLGKEKRDAVLALLPAQVRRDLEAALSFPADAVGAHMSTAIIALQSDETAHTAIEELRRLADSDAEAVFIVDSERKLRGVVPLTALLKAKPAAKLHDLAQIEVDGLSARARLQSIASLSDWDECPQLPVLNRRKMLIGSLSRKALKRSLASGYETGPTVQTSIIGSVAGAFFMSAIGLGQILAEVSPTPVSDDRSN